MNLVQNVIFCCCSSDLQLAIALQQQEFEQQPQRQNVQQPSPVSGNSKLVVGPQVKFLVLNICSYQFNACYTFHPNITPDSVMTSISMIFLIEISCILIPRKIYCCLTLCLQYFPLEIELLGIIFYLNPR